jgi:GT2 family glycosyltransferase
MFEEEYFGYFDEIDLAYRLKMKDDNKLYVTSRAKAYHNHYSASPENKKTRYYFEYYLSERNKFLFYDKYGLRSSKYKMLVTDIIKFPVRLLWFRKVCGWKLGWYYLRGMWDGLRGVKGKPRLEFK